MVLFIDSSSNVGEYEILDCNRMYQRFILSESATINKISAFIFSREVWTGIYYASAMGTVQLFVWKNGVKVANSDAIDLKSVRYGNDPIPLSQFELSDTISFSAGDVMIIDFVFDIGYLGAYLRTLAFPVTTVSTTGFSSIGGLLVENTIQGDTVINAVLTLFFEQIETPVTIPPEQHPPPAPNENIIMPNNNNTAKNLIRNDDGSLNNGFIVLSVGLVGLVAVASGLIIYKNKMHRKHEK